MFSRNYASNYSIELLDKIFHNEKFQFNLSEQDFELIRNVLQENITKIKNPNDYLKFICKPTGLKFQKEHIIKVYRKLVSNGDIKKTLDFEKIMVKKSARSHSGVHVVTIFTSPRQFGDGSSDSIKRGGCPMNCHYCPFEKDETGNPTQPRSYLSTEPGNLRATQNYHHPVGQVFSRLFTLEEIGHLSSIDSYTNSSSASQCGKLEMIISGGTFNFYPEDYIEWFVTCMYFAANTYYQYRLQNCFSRDILSLEEEQKINETSSLRIIGLTIETRPDYLDPRDFTKSLSRLDDDNNEVFKIIRFFRRLGVTRVQIGLQHTDDTILARVNRQCTNEKNKKAIYFLKQNGFKVDGHFMLDLPGATPDIDKMMLDEVLSDSAYEVDQWKIYPTVVTPFTEIKKWYDAGKYHPYAEIDNGALLADVIIHAKIKMKPWIRINRVIRDIPSISIEGGIDRPNMRELIEKKMLANGEWCKCIRCREIKMQRIPEEDVIFQIRHYEGSDGDEYFLSYETMNGKVLLGFLRLRCNKSWQLTMPELHGCAMIRELHVLGKHTSIGSGIEENTQHQGYGKKLVSIAENIARNAGYESISVISGIGVREYYRKLNYYDDSTFMIKNLNLNLTKKNELSIKKLIYELVIIIIFCIILVNTF
jgi:ELP3 family radical SAM enzyme/protein acetyltransferase